MQNELLQQFVDLDVGLLTQEVLSTPLDMLHCVQLTGGLVRARFVLTFGFTYGNTSELRWANAAAGTYVEVAFFSLYMGEPILRAKLTRAMHNDWGGVVSFAPGALTLSAEGLFNLLPQTYLIEEEP